MKRLMFEDFYSWSIFSQQRQIDFNGHLWIRPEGNVLIDPVPMNDDQFAKFQKLGGASHIIITNRDHEREAGFFREKTGAEVIVHEADANELSIKPDRTIQGEDNIFPGLLAIHLRYGKSPGEIALYWRNRGIILVGDLVAGEPMGQFSLLMDEKLESPPKAAYECRKLLRHKFDAILVGDGHSIFHGAKERLVDCLEARSDIYFNRINLDEMEWRKRPPIPGYQFEFKEMDMLIGAKDLGYQVLKLQPGVATYPKHYHLVAEELAYVLEGECALLTTRGDWKARAGDFIAFPAGANSAHKFRNDGDKPCILLIVGNVTPGDVGVYPDSEKVALFPVGIFLQSDKVSYWHGEVPEDSDNPLGKRG